MSATIELKSTLKGNNYFHENGAYQSELKSLYDKHVPDVGSALTLNGELLRAISSLTYEYNNNGNGNAYCEKIGEEESTCQSCSGSGTFEEEDEDGDLVEVDCEDCFGSGTQTEEVVESSYINEMFSKFIELIERTVPGINPIMEKIKETILSDLYHSHDQFSDDTQHHYSQMCDAVMIYILSNEDKDLPSWYDKDSNEL